MPLELFHHAASTCSQKVRLCLAEKGVADWIDRTVDLAANEHLSPAYLKINPNGVVPALRVDGGVIIESSVICEYLDEVVAPAGALTPDDPVARAQMRAWLRYVDEVPSMAIRVPSFQKWFLPKFQRMSADEYEAFKRANPLRRPFMARFDRSEGFSTVDREIAEWQLRQSFERMAEGLAGSRWLCGGRYAIGDLCMLPVVARLEDLELMRLIDGLPAVRDWYDRALARPSYATAFYPGSRAGNAHLEAKC
jgi:glutathione S-transferase